LKTKTNIKNDTIYLYPANLVVPVPPSIVHTILGSCVAVCLFDPKNKIGGINHYMLPFWNGQGLASPKYGNIAIEKLYEKLLENGAEPPHLIAKVFGGGEVIENMTSHFNIGMRNIMLAEEMLKEYRIPIKAQSTGGKQGRKIIFNSFTGEVIQRYVQSSNT
jgi:chemotaxis protein CheD